jgi:cell wall-associated NlpC family hydrolase
MYEAGTGSATVEKVLSSGNTTSALKQAEYSQDLHSYDRKKLNEYVATVEKVAELKDTLETKMDDLEKTQTEYEEQKTELNTTITEKSSEIKDLDVQIDEAVKKAAEAAKKNNNNRNTGGTTNNGGTTNTGGTTNSGATYNPSTGNAIVDAAYSQIGVPYVWGGTTPYVELDCSGLVQYCYRQAGKSIPRTSGSILAGGTIVSDPQPGDICWTPGHVAIYIGNGQMIEAQQTGVPVKVSKVRVVYYVRY